MSAPSRLFEAYELRGVLYTNQHRYDRAIADYDQAIKLKPKFAPAYNNRAVLYNNMGERAKALADYEAALRLDPGNENAIAGRRTVKAEIARLGSEPPPVLSATDTHPSFDCGAARLAVMPVWSAIRPAGLPTCCGRRNAISSPPAMPASASRATICACPCSSALRPCSRRRGSAKVAGVYGLNHAPLG